MCLCVGGRGVEMFVLFLNLGRSVLALLFSLCFGGKRA